MFRLAPFRQRSAALYEGGLDDRGAGEKSGGPQCILVLASRGFLIFHFSGDRWSHPPTAPQSAGAVRRVPCVD